jgi:hypothetical protein
MTREQKNKIGVIVSIFMMVATTISIVIQFIINLKSVL